MILRIPERERGCFAVYVSSIQDIKQALKNMINRLLRCNSKLDLVLLLWLQSLIFGLFSQVSITLCSIVVVFLITLQSNTPQNTFHI